MSLCVWAARAPEQVCDALTVAVETCESFSRYGTRSVRDAKARQHVVPRRMQAACVGRAFRDAVDSDAAGLLDCPVVPVRDVRTLTAARHWLTARTERI